MKTLAALALFAAVFHLGKAAPLEIGTPIPEISAQDENGQKIDLRKSASKGYLLVYFYPMAMTPGCTAQACSLRDAYSELQARGVTIFGVSSDDAERLKKFKQEVRLPFSLLSNTDHTLTQAFGVPTILGKATRQAYLFKDGILAWRDLKASTSKQAEDVLRFINSPQKP